MNPLPGDLRWVVRLLYPQDRVTDLLMTRPLPLNARRARLLWRLVRTSIFDEWIRFHRPFTPRRPNGVAIEITNACNLRCQMCNWTQIRRPLQRMDLGVYRRIVQRCVDAGIRNVRLHTYGETLLHPHLAEMIACAGSRGLVVWISTNGQLLDADAGRRILEAGVAEVRYSVEGATRRTYEEVRVGGKWDRLLANMREFKRLRDELRPQTVIGLNTVLMRETIDDAALLRDVFGSLVDEIHISPLEALGAQGQRLAAGHWLETHDWTKRIPCRLPWDMMNITVDGKATLCCADVDAEVPLGDALEQDLLSIWRGPALQRIRQHHRRRRFDAVSICAECSFGVTNTAINRFRYALLDDRSGYGHRVR